MTLSSVSSEDARSGIRGTGLISCVGASPEDLWQAVSSGRSGIKEGWGAIPEVLVQQVREQVASWSLFRRAAPQQQKNLLSNDALLWSLYALIKSAETGEATFGDDEALIVATTTGQVKQWETAAMSHFRDPSTSAEGIYKPLGSLLHELREWLNFKGPSYVVTSACSASTQALALAHWMLKQGQVKRCYVGGVEVLCELTKTGFGAFQLLSSEVCRPFDRNRSGINLSEGAAFLCLESNANRAQAWIAGAGVSSDAQHMTAPHPEGRGCREAMEKALAEAGVAADELDWIHAHGTGSIHNDAAEAKAISALPFSAMPPVTSTKAIHGHALAASGALEAIICVQALQQQIVPATSQCLLPDEDLSISVAVETQKQRLTNILKNTLGFGGINASLVFQKGAGS